LVLFELRARTASISKERLSCAPIFAINAVKPPDNATIAEIEPTAQLGRCHSQEVAPRRTWAARRGNLALPFGCSFGVGR
jgi:hypothetical protein